MQQTSISPQPGFILSPRTRIGMAALMFLCAVPNAVKGLLRFDWLPWFCFGLFYLYGVPRQKGEPLGAYF